MFVHFLSDPQKLNLNILNIAWWSIGKNNDTQISQKSMDFSGFFPINY